MTFNFSRNDAAAKANGEIFAVDYNNSATGAHRLAATADFGGHQATASHMLSVSLFASANGSESPEQQARQDFIRSIYPDGWDVNGGYNIALQPNSKEGQAHLKTTNLFVSMHAGFDSVHRGNTGDFFAFWG